MRIKTIIGVLVLIAIAAINIDLAFSQDDEMLEQMAADEELQQEFKWLKAETFVITASRIMENIKKSAASITVVTDRQIRQMGATNLVDVLRIVPGFTSATTTTGEQGYLVRGTLPGAHSNTVLLMINSHPVNEAQGGGFSYVNDTLIIDNIKRIEFIRGPSSALYGSSAFLGVINVITKEAKDIDGFELIARGGSWDTQQYNLLYGKTFSDLEVAFNFNYFKTHGFRAFIEEDQQTFLDGLFGSSASLAPGRTKGDDEKYDVSLNLKYKGFTLDGRYVDRDRDRPSVSDALTQKTNASDKDYYLNLSYQTSIWEGLDLSGKVYRNVIEISSDIQGLPPGCTLLTPTPYPPPFDRLPATWAEGLLEKSTKNASRTGIEIQATYRISDSNTIVAGATYEEQKTYDNKTSANYLFSLIPDTIIWLPSVQEWPDDYVQDSQKRNFKAFFLEDIWDITDDIRLATGVRYDRYSDFGGEFSPRVGLTWEFVKGYDLKLLYGHAFRAPSFGEIYFRDPDSELDPETNDTYEVSLGAEFTPSFNSRVTYYYRKREDLIFLTSFTYPFNFKNLGTERDHGFEIEAKYDFGRGTYLSAHYNYMSLNTSWTMQIGDVMANIRLSRYLNFNVDCFFWTGGERLFPDDPRDDPSGAGVVNTTLIAKKVLKGYEGLELRGSVYNLLDKEFSSQTSQYIPNDLPMPDRHYLLEIKYTF